jgi:hypothetical protein
LRFVWEPALTFPIFIRPNSKPMRLAASGVCFLIRSDNLRISGRFGTNKAVGEGRRSKSPW